MRTIKTVIHTLVKQQGEAILSSLGRIQDPQASELVPYIRKLLGGPVELKANMYATKDSEVRPLAQHYTPSPDLHPPVKPFQPDHVRPAW
jgi:hypothetical protein